MSGNFLKKISPTASSALDEQWKTALFGVVGAVVGALVLPRVLSEDVWFLGGRMRNPRIFGARKAISALAGMAIGETVGAGVHGGAEAALRVGAESAVGLAGAVATTLSSKHVNRKEIARPVLGYVGGKLAAWGGEKAIGK